MAQLYRLVASLRIMGDELVPQQITELLGCEPTSCHTKGQIVGTTSMNHEIVRRAGMWTLEATDSMPGDLDKQVAELLGKLPEDSGTWAHLSEHFRMDLFCGLFMEQFNEGLSVSAKTLLELGRRGIELGLCIYGPIQEPR